MNTTSKMGYTSTSRAMSRSAVATGTPQVYELLDGSYAGACEDTIDSDGQRHSWAFLPHRLAEVQLDARTGLYRVLLRRLGSK